MEAVAATVKYSILPSSIHGVGVVATMPIPAGETIGVAIASTTTSVAVTRQLGQYLNHSNHPNSRLLANGDNYNLIATKDIAPNEEITADYNRAPWFVQRAEWWYV